MFSKSNLGIPSATINNSGDSPDHLKNHISLINCYENSRKNTFEEFKKLNKFLFDLNCNEKKLIDNLQTISTLKHSEEGLTKLIQIWDELINELQRNRQDLAININRTMIEPLKKFQIGFNEIKSAIKRYEQLVTDCIKYQQKLQECQRGERTSTQILKQNKYETMLKQAQSDRDNLRSTLERELPLFLQRRIDYIQPSLAAFMCSGILYSGNNLTSIVASSTNSTDLNGNETHRLEKQNELFKALENLSIVSS